MKTKTITALEQALADLGADLNPRHPDEFSAVEMHQKAGGHLSLCQIQRRLKAMAESGAYTRRKFGKDFLYRKAQ